MAKPSSRTTRAPAPATPKTPSFDRKTLRGLLRLLERSGVSEFEYEDAAIRLKIGRGGPPVALGHAPQPSPVAYAPAAAPAAAAALPEDEALEVITSPFVGTFYRSPSPDAPVFVEVGSVIKPGQTLCIIEAMKLMNEIESELTGTVVNILVDNGKAVEFGQPLFKVRRV